MRTPQHDGGSAPSRPFDPAGPYEVQSEDLEYARPAGEALLARVYRPAAPGPWPALVDVHGGAWAYLDRNVDAYFDRALAACGLVVVALDFRQGEQRFPASIRDVLSGIRFVRGNAGALDVAAHAIGVIGGSSGGHLALLADRRSTGALSLPPSIPRIPRAGEFQRLPPIWVAHPEHDRNVTLPMTEDLVAAYRAAGGQAVFEVFPDVGHSFANFPGPAADRCIERMRAFCAGVLSGTP